MPALKRRKIKASSKATLFCPCGICRKNCQKACICCDICNVWYHPHCESLNLQEFEMFKISNSLKYTCTGCFSGENDPYSFTAALLRLDEASRGSLDNLKFVCRRELEILPKIEIRHRASDDQLSACTKDFVSEAILGRCGMTDRGIPLKSLSDGSCLFSSASIAITGDNRFVTELRVRTCVEMVTNHEIYKALPNAPDLLDTSPSFDESSLDCAKPHGFSSQWTIYALSNVLQTHINVIYPPMNGKQDRPFKVFNATCSPRTDVEADRTIKIMWSNISPNFPERGSWTANHFVPLADREIPQEAESSTNFDLADSFELDSFMSTSSSERPLTSSPITSSSPAPEVPTKTAKYHPHGTLNNGTFMETDELFNILFGNKVLEHKYETIPNVTKENIGFLIDNQENMEREKNGQHRKYEDNCGVWGKVSLKTHHFVVDNDKFKYVDFKDEVYSTTVKSKRVPMDPQPDETTVVTLKRAYTKLQRQPTYQRRISWIVSAPNALCKLDSSVAFVEYVGEFPDSTCLHGNNKHGHGGYRRTKDKVVKQIKTMVKTQQPRDIYSELTLDKSVDIPRDFKQIQNFKYNESKKIRPQHQKSANNADDIQILLSMQHGHPFIKEIVQLSGKPPSVIVYTDDQLQDIKRFCSSDSQHILGVDRTFNLGPVYVTLTVFQNKNLVRKVSQTPPIMLGPAYLHWDGSYQTYHRFFSHLQCQLDDLSGTEISGKNLIFGSDEEKAMTKAIRKCFPESCHVLCNRHIEENFKRQLRQMIGEKDVNFRSILNDIFGDDGLLNSPDDVEYDLKTMELEGKYEEHVPQFAKYFKNNTDNLKKFVWEPRKNKVVPEKWTNNACESMNNILKLSTNWKTCKLPELVEKLHKIVQLQYRDIRRALYGEGNYAMASWTRKFQVSHVAWSTKSAEEKDALMKKFQRFTFRKEKEISSSDGNLKIPKTPTTARKPNQKKRIRSTKTTTIKFE